MAQTPQPEATGTSGGATPPAAQEQPSGPGNLTTIILLVLVAVIFWWSMRRRRAFEERMRRQRREQTQEMAARSAQDVANIMRHRPEPEAAAAAATEGLAAAARMPAAPPVPPPTEPPIEIISETVAESDLEIPPESIAALEAAATARALRDRDAGAKREQEAAEALRAGLRELDNEPVAPFGAIVGDGSAECPPEFPIKGNASSMIYHVPGQVSYPVTIPEFCFASPEAAEAAGYRQSKARGQRSQK